MSRNIDILGNTIIFRFVDHEIIDEQPFSELAMENYAGAKSISDAGARIAPNINLYAYFNGISNKFGGY
jgi:hypothetical protein